MTWINKKFDHFRNLYLRIILKRRNVYISKGVVFTHRTEFEDHVKIYPNTLLKDSEIGLGTYIGWNSIFNNCIIGRFCSIAPFAQIIYGTHPSSIFISTHPAFFSKNKQAGFSFTDVNLFDEHKYAIPEKKISVMIGNDVWIGFGTSIMEGVKVGDGAIIAAGSLVTRDVPPYAIVAGIPAKVIKYRFSQLEIDELLRLKWWSKDFNWIQKNHKYFCNISYLNELLNK